MAEISASNTTDAGREATTPDTNLISQAAAEPASEEDAPGTTEELVPGDQQRTTSKVHTRLPVILLAATVVLLVAVGTVLAVGYLRTRDDLAESRSIATARAAELDELNQRQSELAAELARTKAKLLARNTMRY